MKVIDPAKGLHERDCHSSRGRESSDRKRSLDHSAETNPERIGLIELFGGPAEIISPVSLLLFRDSPDMPLGSLFKLQGRELNDTVLLWRICDIDSFVDGKSGDLS